MQEPRISNIKKAMGVLAVAVVIMAVLFLQKKNTYDTNKESLENLRVEQKNIIDHNMKVKAQQEEQVNQLGNKDVKEQTSRFLNLFYNWNSWEKYTKNMETIRKEFPQIEEDSPVDISGTMVGNGDSPLSGHTVDYYITAKKGKIVEMIEQTRNTPTSVTTTTWRGVTQVGEDALFHLLKLDSYVKSE